MALWFLNTMNRTHTERVSIPIRYTSIPQHMTVVNELPGEISVMIKAKGYRILSNRIFKSWSSLEINVDPNYDLRRRQNYYVLAMRRKLDEINYQLGSDITVIDIDPDSIFFQFDLKETKRVPVVVNGTFVFERQHGISGDITVQPDSVTISGSKQEMARLDSVTTEFFTTEKLNKTVIRTVNLMDVAGINFNTTKVQVTVPVEQITEKILEVPVITAKVPDTLQMKVVPEKVRLKLSMPVSQYASVQPGLFEIVATYPGGSNGTIRKVILEVKQKPALVKILQIDPPAVEYLIMIRKK